MTVAYTVGADTFSGNATQANLIYTGNPGVPILLNDQSDGNGNSPFEGPNNQTFYTNSTSGAFNDEAIGVGISFQASVDLGAGVGPIATYAISNNGSVVGGVDGPANCYAVGDAFTVAADSNDATGAVTAISPAAFPVIAWDGARQITLAGDQTAYFPSPAPGTPYAFRWIGSTGGVSDSNMWSYFGPASFDGTNTTIAQLNAPSPSVATASGSIISTASGVTSVSFSSLGTFISRWAPTSARIRRVGHDRV